MKLKLLSIAAAAVLFFGSNALAETVNKSEKSTAKPVKAAKADSPAKSAAPDRKAAPIQNTDPAPPAPIVPAVTENDHLSFMQTEQTAQNEEPSSGGLLLKTIGAMLLVVGLIFFAAWGIRKLGLGGVKAGKASDPVELTVLSSVTMGSGRTISTVRFGGRVLLVGSTAESFTLLAEESDKEEFQVGGSRSVAEMLAEEEEATFGIELEQAEMRLGRWNTGERLN